MQLLKTRLLVALFSVLVYNLSAQSWQTKVHESVFEALAQHTETEIIVVMRAQADVSAADNMFEKNDKGAFVYNTLTTTASNTQKDLISFLNITKTAYTSMWLVNAVYLPHATSALIEQIAAREEVAEIINNPKSRREADIEVDNTAVSNFRTNVISWGIPKTKADSVWLLGYRGQNVVVGGADTGYDWLHPALNKKYRGTLANGTISHDYNWHDAIHLDTSVSKGNPCGYDIKAPCDDVSHGTHTMGSMIGSTDTIFTGMAPDAKWVGARNMDRGDGTLVRYVECWQWFIAPTKIDGTSPNTSLAPHVINNSWYCATTEGCNSSNFAVLNTALEKTRASGIVVVVSNGNAGPACNTTSGPPAFFKKAFSVGATQINDTIAGFSSRGNVTIDSSNRLKPEISAPGAVVYSSIPNNGYAYYSGTSMAGPHVVGLVALMISANPKLAGQVDTIESIIKQTAKSLTTGAEKCGGVSSLSVPNNTYGYGRIDALAAVKRALKFVRTPTVEFTTQNFKLFPNPANDNLVVSCPLSVALTYDITISNMAGQILSRQTKLSGLSNQINIASLPSGVYLVSVSNSDGVSTQRFIKL